MPLTGRGARRLHLPHLHLHLRHLHLSDRMQDAHPPGFMPRPRRAHIPPGVRPRPRTDKSPASCWASPPSSQSAEALAQLLPPPGVTRVRGPELSPSRTVDSAPCLSASPRPRPAFQDPRGRTRPPRFRAAFRRPVAPRPLSASEPRAADSSSRLRPVRSEPPQGAGAARGMGGGGVNETHGRARCLLAELPSRRETGPAPEPRGHTQCPAGDRRSGGRGREWGPGGGAWQWGGDT